jgi:UDPglucose 6-dehydrogenase
MAKKGVNSISVIGLGKLGLCVAACFADKGFEVIGADIDIEKIGKINRGISPIEETSLQEYLTRCRKRLKATVDVREAVLKSEVSFIVVATPSLADGSFSNEYLEKALLKIGGALRKKKGYHLVVVTSTVMPQATGQVARAILENASGKRCGRDFGLAYNPEFIALGSVIHDFLNPDFILIGETNKKDGNILEGIYRRTCENQPRFARMSLLNAEITKITLNCYVTTKITFANSLAALCERLPGADAEVVTKAIGLDSRIGGKYLRPGLGFGGPCFPRDNLAFAAFARRLETRAKLAEMVDEVNRDQVSRVVARVNEIIAGLKKGKQAKVAVLGLSYKPQTPVAEQSQALGIAQALANEGYAVKVYDPQAMAHARAVLGEAVRYARNMRECLAGADIGIIAVPWKEFERISPKDASSKIVLLDCWGLLKEKGRLRVEYLGKGA